MAFTIAAIFAATLPIGLAFLAYKSRNVVPDVGIVEGRLRDCPATPNCVGSTASRADQRVAPFDWPSGTEDPLDWIGRAVAAMPRARIADRSPEYLRVEMRSRIFGFADDLEFLVDRTNRRIEVRACARVGRSDFGANRRHVETVRRLCDELRTHGAAR